MRMPITSLLFSNAYNAAKSIHDIEVLLGMSNFMGIQEAMSKSFQLIAIKIFVIYTD